MESKGNRGTYLSKKVATTSRAISPLVIAVDVYDELEASENGRPIRTALKGDAEFNYIRSLNGKVSLAPHLLPAVKLKPVN